VKNLPERAQRRGKERRRATGGEATAERKTPKMKKLKKKRRRRRRRRMGTKVMHCFGWRVLRVLLAVVRHHRCRS